MVVVFTVLTNRDISRLGGSDTRACTIPLTVELDELAAPILVALRHDILQPVEHRARDAWSAVLGDENQVVRQRIQGTAVARRASGYCFLKAV